MAKPIELIVRLDKEETREFLEQEKNWKPTPEWRDTMRRARAWGEKLKPSP